MSIHFVAGSEFVELPRPEHNFVWQSSIQIFIYVFWHLLPAGMLKYLSWEGGNRGKEKNAIPNDLHVIQYLFLFGWKALKKEELWTHEWSVAFSVGQLQNKSEIWGISWTRGELRKLSFCLWFPSSSRQGSFNTQMHFHHDLKKPTQLTTFIHWPNSFSVSFYFFSDLYK